jgi:bifunctional non-homologous end joining protein LigD
VRISNPDKVLYPEAGITKEVLARYYQAVAPWMIPHVAGRPLTLVRCPQGYAGDCFFQKHMDEVDSPHVRRIRVKDAEGARDYGAIYDLPGLLTAVQLGVLELHTWNSRADRLESPDRVTFDIDPDPTVTWDDTVQAAFEVRALLAELALECFVKTTGGKGLHVVVPLVRRSGWEQVKEFSRSVAATLAAANPGRYTLQLSKSHRRGRLLLDYLRNTRGATAVEVYSTRARPGAPVSTPVSWDELQLGVDPQGFTVETVPRRLAAGVDPWREYGAMRQSLTAPLLRRLGIG